MTRQESRLLAYIKRFQHKFDGATPSFDAMCKELKLTAKSGIFRMMAQMEAKGLLKRIRKDGVYCGIKIMGEKCKHCGREIE